MFDTLFATENEDSFHDLMRTNTPCQSAIFKGTHALSSVEHFAESVAAGLGKNPPQLECRFLYDKDGSDLYERITHQPEYYLTRTEAAILAAKAPEIREVTGPVTLVEFGSGSSVKTAHLLQSYIQSDGQVTYVPIDVSDSALQAAGESIARRHPQARVVGLNATYEEALPMLSQTGPVMALFLGSTIGNFTPEAARLFLEQVSSSLPPGGFFLLGVDLVKDSSILEAAYNDAAGVTAAFTRNLFARMNRELGSGIDLDAVQHMARYNAGKEQIEIDACFIRDQRIRISPLQCRFDIPRGTRIRTEVSRKFRLERLLTELQQVGFILRRVFTDERNWFSLLLLGKGTAN